jgi:hypothetical protein
MMQPAIVVVTYNRPESLSRLLASILGANYPENSDVTLVISIDHSGNEDVITVAQDFDWPYGEKVVVAHETNIGLRCHILSCGDMTAKYGAVIILEDDLFVSPAFYSYSTQAINFYGNTSDICGISLYAPEVNEYVCIGFTAVNDGYDNYFVQSASSWGQVWTQKQWQAFKVWYGSAYSEGVNGSDNVPEMVAGWPETSWKKYFIKYQTIKNNFFVYPRVSLTTNFCDVGQHNKINSMRFQVPLLISEKQWKFSTLVESRSIYDAFFELHKNLLNRLLTIPDVDGNVESDIFGTKKYKDISCDYVLTLKRPKISVQEYSDALTPSILNAFYGLKGTSLYIVKKDEYATLEKNDVDIALLHDFNNVSLRVLFKLIVKKSFQKIRLP